MTVSTDAVLRDPVTEVGDSYIYLISLGPVQPRNVEVRATDVLVSMQLKRVRFQEGWYSGCLFRCVYTVRVNVLNVEAYKIVRQHLCGHFNVQNVVQEFKAVYCSALTGELLHYITHLFRVD